MEIKPVPMNKLHPDWVTEGLIDFEYKKYLLLAYLQWVSKRFTEQKLYPFLSDLVFHYRNLVSIRDSRSRAKKQFPKKLSRLDFEQFRVEYEKMVEDGAYMETIGQILEFAIPKIEGQLREGRDIYEFVEEQLSIEPIGIMPIDSQAGFFFLHVEQKKDTRVYSYDITLFENQEETYRGIRTTYLEHFSPSLTRTFESFKLELIKRHKDRPNPAAWLVSSPLSLPIEETFLPIAKRSLVRHIAKQ